MEAALASAFGLGSGDDYAVQMLLITDGQVHDQRAIVQRVAGSGHRIFAVGVGTAVSEGLLRAVAEVTGGACELVASQEGMADRVLAQFHRMHEPRQARAAMVWPARPTWQSALPETIFAGDTVHIFAWFDEPIEGRVTLAVDGIDRVGTEVVTTLDPNLARLAAATRLTSADDAEGLALALEYQLVSRWTHYLVIAPREIRAEGLPQVHTVPQMPVAGQGNIDSMHLGFGDYDCCLIDYTSPALVPDPPKTRADVPRSPGLSDFDASGTVSCAPRGGADVPSRTYGPASAASSPGDLVRKLQALCAREPNSTPMPPRIADLASLGLPAEVVHSLTTLTAQGVAEAMVIVVFLKALAETAVAPCFDRHYKQAIAKALMAFSKTVALETAFANALTGTTAESWIWNLPAESCNAVCAT